MKLAKPINQHALAIYFLIEAGSKGLTMADMCKEHFYKFQTRLLEVEKPRKNKLKILRLRMHGKNRFGHPVSYINYKSLAHKKYLINLFNKLNKSSIKTK